jgi:hypothetical protein
LGLRTFYGVNKWPVKDMVYMHILKNREGALQILQFVNNLQYNRIDEPGTLF